MSAITPENNYRCTIPNTEKSETENKKRDTVLKRAWYVCKNVGFVCVFLPFELTRLALMICTGVIFIPIAPLEYIITGDIKFTQKVVRTVEFGGRQFIKDFVVKHDILSAEEAENLY